MRKLLICAVTLVALACMSAAASAHGAKARRAIELNSECGTPFHDEIVGAAKLSRTGNVVNVHFKLTAFFGEFGGPEGVAWFASLWNVTGGACELVGRFPGEINPNKRGVGRLAGSVTVPAADTEFVAMVFDNMGQRAGTPPVTLP